MTMTTTTTPQTKLVCDICLKKDGWRGLFLQQCCKCGVCVHHECYGGVESPSVQKKKWQCMACQAVGTEIEGFTLEGRKHKIMEVTERPVECVLCSVADGVHAMHPLYHYYGERGRQAILPGFRKVPERLAWVHTVCARGVSQHVGTKGAVYGCHEDGEESSDLIHHFVMSGLNQKDDEEEWVTVLEEHRKLPCTICEEDGVTPANSLRVPLQCCAGDGDEYFEFKQHHEDVVETCTQAMHVGCAMWRQKGVRRMWFIPGCAKDHDDEAEDVVGIFCDSHSTQIGASMTGRQKSSIQTNVSSTVLQRSVCESAEPVLHFNSNANTTHYRSSQLHSTDARTGFGFASTSAIPRRLKRKRSISEGKESDADQNDTDDGHASRHDNLSRTDDQGDGKEDGGMWMDDEAYEIVQGDYSERDPPKGKDPWAYLWEPGAPPFKMELIACADRRNVEGLVKSLYLKKEK